MMMMLVRRGREYRGEMGCGLKQFYIAFELAMPYECIYTTGTDAKPLN